MTNHENNRCFHCGEDNGINPVVFDNKYFCCNGCRSVFEILDKNNACNYYSFENHPGVQVKNIEIGSKYAYLDNNEIKAGIIDFSEGGVSRVKLFIPIIHCSSCIWILENLNRFSSGIFQSTVNFSRKEVTLLFRESEISLRQVVELLVSINYIPQVSNIAIGKHKKPYADYGILYRLGVAGFCFGNIMLFSFPEYLSVNDSVEQMLQRNFGILNILFAIPVAFYSGSGYFQSAWAGLRKKFISIDFPISLGILVLFFRSFYEIYTHTGPGFMDSLAGLVFFLLIGKWYQNITYQALSFDRDYRSYFPMGVTVISDSGEEQIIPLKNLKIGNRLLIRHLELIPADSVLVMGEGQIDYSFVSGESTPIYKKLGNKIFAGGRQVGSSIEIIVESDVEQSRLTELWNQNADNGKTESKLDTLLNRTSRRLTLAIILLAFSGGIFWWFTDSRMAIHVFTSVLIIACPCALALTVPFTFGGTMRIFGKNGFYLKKNTVIETMSQIDTVVFDKTGTLTKNDAWRISFQNMSPDNHLFSIIRSLTRHSTHPLSVALNKQLSKYSLYGVDEFQEFPGKGIQAKIEGQLVKLGSASFVNFRSNFETNTFSKVYVSVDEKIEGEILFNNEYREGLESLINQIRSTYQIHLLSGDNDSELPFLLSYFENPSNIRFNQSPIDKLNYIENLKTQGRKVLMIGDGLNDAGALRSSNCGISIADDVYHFSPACDAILDSKEFENFSEFLHFSKLAMRIVKYSLAISLLYNIIGVSFALSGLLTPLIAAILMPLSSVSVVLFVSLSVHLLGRRKKF